MTYHAPRDHDRPVAATSRDNDPLAIATQSGGISTVGFTNITLTYEWSPTNNTELATSFGSEWRDGPAGSWTEIARHELIGPASFVFASWGIADAAGLSDFQFRFRAAVNANNEGAYIDNVSLAGDPATGRSRNPARSCCSVSALRAWE